MSHRIIEFATRRPWTVFAMLVAMTLALGVQLPRIHIDTDPENMLAADQPDRVFHSDVERIFSQHDVVVVGAVNETHPDGIYNPRSMAALDELNRQIEAIDGVITADLLSLPTADNIRQGAAGELVFEWMMATPPGDRAAARRLRSSVERLPLLMNTLVSGDGKAAAIYVPIADKSMAYEVANRIRSLTAELDSDDTYHITGLPVAEVTFGHDMFIQMGISAPLAGVMIMILLWVFFRNLRIVLAPMAVAMITVIGTMGLLIGLGFTVHIMSSMIPIFLMPIAVVDSVHILSEFSDSYRKGSDPRPTVARVVGHLFRPMLLTSLTSAVGFASLMLTPIPPVQVFGAFVACGILLAFLVTVTFIPAYIARLEPRQLESLGGRAEQHDGTGAVAVLVRRLGATAFRRGPALVAVTAVLVAVSAIGVSRIRINDNPVRWFKPGHEIRVADRSLNRHFAGTYDAFLVLEQADAGARQGFEAQARRLLDRAHSAGIDVSALSAALDDADRPDAELFSAVVAAADDLLFDTDAEDTTAVEELMVLAETAESDARYFHRPEALAIIEGMQATLLDSGYVGKSNALPDVVKVLNRELRAGDDADYVLPSSRAAVAQLLMQFQSSHRPWDLWHLVTPDFKKTALWIQLRSGDNQDMSRVLEVVDRHLAAHPLPEGVTARWAGKTYINVVWQDAMVNGMLRSLLGAFAFVFVMMVVLFRSLRLGILAMIPLSVTILGIYGLIGWIGKDYDMPIAVLSSLTLGLSVDFAIHFLERFRSLLRSGSSYVEAGRAIFEEPGRAITRNALVIALGFTPLFLAPLVPYITVGAFMTLVMAVSGLATLVLLPAVIGTFRRITLPGFGARKLQGAAAGLLLLASLQLGSPASLAEDPDADAIVARANLAAYYAGDDGRAEVRLTITDAQGREQRRQFTILRRDVEDAADQQFLVVFSQPADLRNTVFLVAKHAGRDDDRWLYLPGLDLVKRISAGDKRTSFVGSHVLYEDVSGRGTDEDRHDLVEKTDEFYVLKHTPIDRGSVEFASYTTWIDRDTWLPMKIEYADDAGTVLRRITALEVEELDGKPTVVDSRVEDLSAGGSTRMQFRFIHYDVGLPDDVFAERSLRQPPARWLKSPEK